MESLILFLNKNAGAIQGIFAGVVAIATVVYAFLTSKMWQEMRYTNERLNEPNVQAVIGQGKKVGYWFELVIKNIGNVSVYDVSIDVSPKDFPGFTTQALRELNLFNVPISVLTEGQEIRTILFDYRSAVSDKDKDTIISFTISYSTANGKKYSQVYNYNLNIYWDMVDMSAKSFDDIVEELGDLKDELKKMTAVNKELVEKIDWNGKIILSKLDGSISLEGTLIAYLSAWSDFKLLGDEAFRGLHLYSMRTTCLGVYNKLCMNDHTANAYTELRTKLLKMAQKQFLLDGGRSRQEFLILGDEVTAQVQQLKEKLSITD